VNNPEQAIVSVLIIITEKIGGAIGLPSVLQRDALQVHHGELKTQVKHLFLSLK
jgi:hypothetical protein